MVTDNLPDTLGLVETRAIATGVLLADAMVKAARVTLMRASTLCSGRYFVQIAGDRAAVDTAIGAAEIEAEKTGYPLIGSFVISRVHPELIEGIGKTSEIPKGDAIGVIECRSTSAGLVAADQALKKAHVHLARIVLGQSISGKSYFVINGDVAEIQEAVALVNQQMGKSIFSSVVIPSPDEDVVAALTLKKRVFL